MPPQPLISIIIPTKNGAFTIYRCLQSISEQTYQNLEVLLVDSGSEDETISIASKFDLVRILQIAPHTFNHGSTRNLGVSEAKGEFILFTVQDAYASSSYWVENMLSHFLKDEQVVGVCGQQVVPHDADKNPHEWFRPYSTPVPRTVQVKDKQTFDSLTPAEFYGLCGWDNVNAMYRKSELLKYPFDVVSFGEDLAWAKKVVINGEKIVYDYSCRVFHYHHATFDYTYKRTLTVLYFIYKNFGYIRRLEYNLTDYLKVVYRNFKYRASLFWIPFNWTRMNAIAQAFKDFEKQLRISEDALDQYHREMCGTPPQGMQNTTPVA